MRQRHALTTLAIGAMLALSGTAGAAIVVLQTTGFVDGNLESWSPYGSQHTTTDYDFAVGNWTANVDAVAAGPSPGTGRAATTGAITTSTTATSNYASFAMSGTGVGVSASGCAGGTCGGFVGDPSFQISQSWTFQVTAGSSYEYAGLSSAPLSGVNNYGSLQFSHGAVLQKIGSPGFLFLQSAILNLDGTGNYQTLGDIAGVLTEGTYSYRITTAGLAYSDTALTRAAWADTFSQLQVGTTPVPLPAAAWLLLSGVGGVAAFARRRRQENLPRRLA